ncbi:MAG TPA: hypothetical protein DCZ74_05985 [Treponema sp.]|nr:hypothetical protein [Treponema sp.]
MLAKRIFLTFLISLCVVPVFAKKKAPEPKETAAPEEEAEVEISPEETWQILSWEEDSPENVLHYDVIIEVKDEDSGKFSETRRIETEDNSTTLQIKPSLSPGVYRYSVVSYNMLNMPSVQSDWETFVVYRAYSPLVTDIKVDVNLGSTMYLEEVNDGILTLSGQNLFMPPEDSESISFTTYQLKRNNSPITLAPIAFIDHSSNNKRFKLQFDEKKLDVGTYRIITTDASGLKNPEHKGNLLTVKFKKWMDLDVSAGYQCPLVLFDDTFKKYFEAMLYPFSFTARVTFLPFKHRWGYLGIGFHAFYTSMTHSIPAYTIHNNLGSAHLYFAYQKHIPKARLTLEAHAGAGIAGYFNYYFTFEHDIKSKPETSLDFSAMAGGAVQWYVFKRLYIEIGADFIFSLVPNDMTFGALIPSVSIGWQF